VHDSLDYSFLYLDGPAIPKKNIVHRWTKGAGLLSAMDRCAGVGELEGGVRLTKVILSKAYEAIKKYGSVADCRIKEATNVLTSLNEPNVCSSEALRR
jgi:hypothetical protein